MLRIDWSLYYSPIYNTVVIALGDNLHPLLQCTQWLPLLLRMAVVFRDPRDVVISSHRYRTETSVVKNQFVPPDLLNYINYFFEVSPCVVVVTMDDYNSTYYYYGYM